MPKPTLTPEQRKDAARRTIAVIFETIQDASAASPLGGIPNGHLYTLLMSSLQIDFDTYMNVIAFLKEGGYVKEFAHLLSSTGKEFPWKSGV